MGWDYWVDNNIFLGMIIEMIIINFMINYYMVSDMKGINNVK